MKTKLVHLLHGYIILIIVIAIFPPAPFGQPGCQFHFKWKSQARGWKIFQEWSQNVAFWVILLSKKWRLEGGGKCPPCPFQNWRHWGKILSIIVVKPHDSLLAIWLMLTQIWDQFRYLRNEQRDQTNSSTRSIRIAIKFDQTNSKYLQTHRVFSD